MGCCATLSPPERDREVPSPDNRAPAFTGETVRGPWTVICLRALRAAGGPLHQMHLHEVWRAAHGLQGAAALVLRTSRALHEQARAQALQWGNRVFRRCAIIAQTRF